jgi:hypothetical protein
LDPLDTGAGKGVQHPDNRLVRGLGGGQQSHRRFSAGGFGRGAKSLQPP